MSKLLSTDYSKIIEKTFSLPENDFQDYYLNEINIHYNQNPDIIIRLSHALAEWKRWFYSQIPNINAYEVDELGNESAIDRMSIQISLMPYFNRHISLSFFEKQIEIVDHIVSIIEFTKKLEDTEKSLSIKQIKQLNTISEFPKYFDLLLLNKRWAAHKVVRSLDSVNGNENKRKPQLFRDLFLEKYKMKVYVFMQMLHVSEADVIDVKTSKGVKQLKPLINVEGVWIGNRQAARVYYEALLSKNIVVDVARTKYAEIFYKMFGINVSFVSQEPKDGAIDYKDYFNKEIDKILTEINN